jgi:RimJ/RimL family protein N-acetyltransferase
MTVELRELTIEESLKIQDGPRPTTGWAPEFPSKEDVGVARFAKFMPSTNPEPWLSPWQIVENDIVVGMLGFKGEPVGNILEVGYGIVPCARGRGIATIALSLLLAKLEGRGLVVQAETAVWNIPSQGVLEKLSFKEIGRRPDNNHGDLIVWEITVN